MATVSQYGSVLFTGSNVAAERFLKERFGSYMAASMEGVSLTLDRDEKTDLRPPGTGEPVPV